MSNPLMTRRDEITTELRSINEAHPDNTLPADVQTRWNSLMEERNGLEERIARQQQIDALDRTAPGTRVGGGAMVPEVRIGGFEGGGVRPADYDGAFLHTQDGTLVPALEARHSLSSFAPAQPESRASELGLGGYLRALWRGPQNDLERRALSEGSIGTGGALLPAPLAAGIIDDMRAAAVCFQAGARTIPMTAASLTFARVNKTPVGAWRAEGAPIAEDEPAFDQVKLSAKAWAVRCKVSRELLEDGQNLDTVIRQAFAASASLGLDYAILFGTGDANQPLGVTNTPGIHKTALNGALTNWDPILDAVYDLEASNLGTVSGMVMNPRTNRAIRGFKDTTGNPLQAPADLQAVKRLTTTAIPTNEGSDNGSSIVLGDFSQIYVGMRTSLQISVLNEVYSETGEIGFLAWMRADVLTVRPQALEQISGITVPAK